MIIHQISREQLKELWMSSSGKYLRVYKAVSRLGVDKSSEQDFIKVILTKNQERDKKNKE